MYIWCGEQQQNRRRTDNQRVISGIETKERLVKQLLALLPEGTLNAVISICTFFVPDAPKTCSNAIRTASILHGFDDPTATLMVKCGCCSGSWGCPAFIPLQLHLVSTITTQTFIIIIGSDCLVDVNVKVAANTIEPALSTTNLLWVGIGGQTNP